MISYDEALLGEIISSKIPFYCIMEILCDFIETICLSAIRKIHENFTIHS